MDSQTSLKRFTALNELIERDYVQETTMGSFVVLRRKSEWRREHRVFSP